jgi:hypothetical protein
MATPDVVTGHAQLIADLRAAAVEIAAEGHDGWGNLCSLAADTLDSLQPTCVCGKYRLDRGRDIAYASGLEFHSLERCVAPKGSPIPDEDFTPDMLK